jgi:multicomponent K+:H+ antiporter subunit F
MNTLTTLTSTFNGVFTHAVHFAQLCFALAMLCATVRLVQGPAAQDRVLALDALYTSGLLTLLTLGIRSQSTAYFDMALLIALFGFVSTLALSRFLLRGEVIEP